MSQDPASIESWYGTIATVVGSVVSTLVGSILYLARLIESKYKAEIDKLNGKIATLEVSAKECLDQRQDYATRLARLEGFHDHEKQEDGKQ